MPGLTLNTGQAAAAGPSSYAPSSSSNRAHANADAQPPQIQPQSSSRSSSPVPPTYSPITPPLNPVSSFPPPRPTYTHASQADQTAVAPPPPEPINFDTNPDVLALKSAISILQLQRRKAEVDMATLDRVKAAALAEPEAFVRDLTAGRIRVEGDRLYVTSNGAGAEADSDSDSDSESDVDMEDAERSTAGRVDGQGPAKGEQEDAQMSGAGEGSSSGSSSQASTSHRAAAATSETKKKKKRKKKDKMPSNSSAWATLPKPQNVVRCPPINWSQYAVVGESLDKLHNEQLSRPTQGTPAAIAADGRYEFSGGSGKQEKLVGIAAPYMPGKDKVERKPRGSKR
ncbi:hypothetical protein AAE478_000878 [Parahypoxylon ruwenzoriense]